LFFKGNGASLLGDFSIHMATYLIIAHRPTETITIMLMEGYFGFFDDDTLK
jgi:hypothetical protein